MVKVYTVRQTSQEYIRQQRSVEKAMVMNTLNIAGTAADISTVVSGFTVGLAKATVMKGVNELGKSLAVSGFISLSKESLGGWKTVRTGKFINKIHSKKLDGRRIKRSKNNCFNYEMEISSKEFKKLKRQTSDSGDANKYYNDFSFFFYI